MCSSGALVARYNQQRNSKTMKINNNNNNNNNDNSNCHNIVVDDDDGYNRANYNNNNDNNNKANDQVDAINESHQEYTIKDLPLIPDDDMIWDTCAYYIAQLCVSLILIASPELICIGMMMIMMMMMIIIIILLMLMMMINYPS